MRKLIGVVVASALAVATPRWRRNREGGERDAERRARDPRARRWTCASNGATAIPDFAPGTVITGVELPAGSLRRSRSWPPNDDCADAAILEVTASR